MAFYFHLYGNRTGVFDVETKQGSEKSKSIFRRYGNHGMTWQRAQVYINITGEYKVIVAVNFGFKLTLFILDSSISSKLFFLEIQ